MRVGKYSQKKDEKIDQKLNDSDEQKINKGDKIMNPDPSSKQQVSFTMEEIKQILDKEIKDVTDYDVEKIKSYVNQQYSDIASKTNIDEDELDKNRLSRLVEIIAIRFEDDLILRSVYKGLTFLHLAADVSNLELVEKLFNRNIIDIGQTTADQDTPLYIALVRDDNKGKAITKFLLEKLKDSNIDTKSIDYINNIKDSEYKKQLIDIIGPVNFETLIEKFKEDTGQPSQNNSKSIDEILKVSNGSEIEKYIREYGFECISNAQEKGLISAAIEYCSKDFMKDYKNILASKAATFDLLSEVIILIDDEGASLYGDPKQPETSLLFLSLKGNSDNVAKYLLNRPGFTLDKESFKYMLEQKREFLVDNIDFQKYCDSCSLFNVFDTEIAAKLKEKSENTEHNGNSQKPESSGNRSSGTTSSPTPENSKGGSLSGSTSVNCNKGKADNDTKLEESLLSTSALIGTGAIYAPSVVNHLARTSPNALTTGLLSIYNKVARSFGTITRPFARTIDKAIYVPAVTPTQRSLNMFANTCKSALALMVIAACLTSICSFAKNLYDGKTVGQSAKLASIELGKSTTGSVIGAIGGAGVSVIAAAFGATGIALSVLPVAASLASVYLASKAIDSFRSNFK